MVPSDRIAAGVSAYIDREILPHLPETKALVLGAAVALYVRRLNDLICMIPKNMHVTDESNNVDVDAICDALKERMNEPITMELPFIGRLTFDAPEVDKIRRYIIDRY